MTVTSGTPGAQVRAVSSPNRSDSQADSASSILVTRSTVPAHVRDGIPGLGLDRSGTVVDRPCN
jgi:hypothetical protein